MQNVADLKNGIRIHDIQKRLCDYSDGYICDVITEIADNDVDIYYSDLFEWAKDNWSYIDDACQEFGMPSCNDTNIIIKLIQQGQFYYNEQLLYEDLDSMLLNFCYNYIEYDLKINEIAEEQQEEIENKCTNVDNNDMLEDFTEFLDDLFNSEDDEEEI